MGKDPDVPPSKPLRDKQISSSTLNSVFWYAGIQCRNLRTVWTFLSIFLSIFRNLAACWISKGGLLCVGDVRLDKSKLLETRNAFFPKTSFPFLDINTQVHCIFEMVLILRWLFKLNFSRTTFKSTITHRFLDDSWDERKPSDLFLSCQKINYVRFCLLEKVKAQQSIIYQMPLQRESLEL